MNSITKVNRNTLTVQQFLDLYRLSINTTDTEQQKLENAVAIVYNLSQQQVENLQMKKFVAMGSHAAKFLTTAIPGKAKRYITGNGNRYKITYNPTLLKHRQYVEVVHYARKPIENMHLVLASIVQPVKFKFFTQANKGENHERIANDLLQAPVKDIYHACVFFCKLYENLMATTQDYLVNEIMKTKQVSRTWAEKMITASRNVSGGFIPQQE